ncbi:MAG TPA: hypothetical protein VFE47_09725 [Tepidisphaeraceae bacterium]|jgi:hypothetical protein|nr:hypothetical protein [Tepidisphaeraceae bacterium]
MGLNWHGAKFLASIRRDGTDFSRAITIGRLNLNVSMPKVRQILDSYAIPHALPEEQVLGKTTYAEPVFKLLGAQTVDSMDASDYEQATVIADLNKPIADALKAQYDLVYDGGTIEHVFDVRQTFENLMSLPKVGGSLVIQTMANNWFGHGFFQFSPELFYRVLSPENGYKVQQVIVHESYEFAQWYDVPDPAAVRGRIELANNWRGVMVAVHARREAIVPLFQRTPQQSDYSARWDSGEPHRPEPQAAAANSASKKSASPGTKKRLIANLKQKLPWALRLKHRMLMAFPALPRFASGRGHRRERKKFSLQAQPDKFRPVS